MSRTASTTCPTIAPRRATLTAPSWIQNTVLVFCTVHTVETRAWRRILNTHLPLVLRVEGFLFLAYYPALALFVAVFPSPWIGLA